MNRPPVIWSYRFVPLNQRKFRQTTIFAFPANLVFNAKAGLDVPRMQVGRHRLPAASMPTNFSRYRCGADVFQNQPPFMTATLP